MSSLRYWRVILEPEPESTVWEVCRDNDIIAIGYPSLPNDFNVRRFRDEMKIGDKIVAYLKNYEIGALGIIEGDYCIDETFLCDENKWRIRKVKWNHKTMYGWSFRDELNESTKSVLSQRPTVVEIDKGQYEEIENLLLAL